MSDPTWLDYVAAGATAASAAVIAWQAWQTRAAVRASEATVKTGQESVLVATNALRESQLSRLEAGVPRITVTSPVWVAGPPTVLAPTDSEPWAKREVTSGDVFKLPRDAQKTVSAQHSFVVRNDGPGAVSVSIKPYAYAEADTPEVIVPGAERTYRFFMNLKVERWVEIQESGSAVLESERSSWPEAYRVAIIYEGPRDADVTEVHELVVYGSILQPVKDAKGDWAADTTGWNSDMRAIVLPATRTYWRSRSKDEKF